jgi:hypothetical protein
VALPERPATAAGVSTDPRSWERGTWWRRGFLTVVGVVVLAGLFGVFGLRSRTVEAQSPSGAVSLKVEYAQVARAGLDVPFDIEVHRRGGFHDDVVLQLSTSYLDLFDRSSVDPQPDEETATSRSVLWRFHRPPTDTLTVSVEMQVQQGKHWGRAGAVAVLGPSGRTLARTTFTTWLAP